jgi:hypothetical protein
MVTRPEVIPNCITRYNQRSKEIVDDYHKEQIAVKYGKGWIQHPRNLISPSWA